MSRRISFVFQRDASDLRIENYNAFVVNIAVAGREVPRLLV